MPADCYIVLPFGLQYTTAIYAGLRRTRRPGGRVPPVRYSLYTALWRCGLRCTCRAVMRVNLRYHTYPSPYPTGCSCSLPLTIPIHANTGWISIALAIKEHPGSSVARASGLGAQWPTHPCRLRDQDLLRSNIRRLLDQLIQRGCGHEPGVGRRT